ncbi:hypothetical protein Trydic_g17140 [Trypoxylus dichotomus]
MSERSSSNMDKPTPTAAIMLEKAFDKVWYDGLIHKRRLPRIPAKLANLIQHYLRDRTFSVKVFQGSVLGPLLFNIYTSDIP